jgi:hypothetical protein
MRVSALRWLVLLALGFSSSNLRAQQPASQNSQYLSDELNSKLPGWLSFSGEYRFRLEGFTGGGFKSGNDDMYPLSRLRLNMKIQPASWLKFVFQGQDARTLGEIVDKRFHLPPYQDTMDLRQAYVEIGDAEKKTAGLRIGRQELAFGEERLIGNVNWLNTARSFDGARATFHRKGYRLDAFAASVVNIHEGQFNENIPGNNIYGLYGGLEKLVPQATLEPYLIWRRASNLPTETKTRGTLNFATVGFRWVGKLPANFDYGTEMAKQAGSLGTDSISAWAGHWVLGYTVARARFKPRVLAEYNFASGDHNPTDGKRGTFDQLYPTGHDKYGLADQVGWKNIHHLRGGVEFTPRAKWLLTGRYSAWWLADSHDALYSAGGAVVARVANGSAGRYVGQELDFLAVYSLSKQIQTGGGFGHILPGTFLKRATPGEAYNLPYATLTFSF